ncbi:MAG TPA: hypothetical protein VLJ79_35435 [Candidatus Binatia bacterium]|nr:hypothetical protein [Candidatus Binatia bacterium]
MRTMIFGRTVVAFLMLGFGVVQAATVEERLEQINRMGDKARSEALEKEASKEREVVWYAAMGSDRAFELIKGRGAATEKGPPS